MESILSEMIITKIHAFNRVNIAQGSKSGYLSPRERSAVAIKTEGQTEYKSNDRVFCSDQTHAVILPKGSVYSFVCKQKGECLMIEFDGENLPEFPTAVKIKNVLEISMIFSRIERLMMFKKPAYHAKCMQGVYEIFVKLCEGEYSDYGLTSKKNKIAKSVDYLEKHCLTDTISIETLAQMSGISSVYFRKIFCELYGTSPMQYINRIRMEKAKGLLLGDCTSITEAAFLSGYGSVYHFCKAFKKATGLTPGEWAKSTRNI